jgi:MYXO-CTERM domain-containing protein
VEGVSELSPVRALFVDADGRLVVAGDRHILRFRPSNGVEKTHALSDLEKVFGEIRTMAPRKSGGLVVGLMEPGVWTEPHQNHEVLAFSSTSGELEISSRTEFVESAPAAVRFLDGRAATGRLGYQPGVDTASRPDLELRVDSLSSEFVSYRPTMQIRLSISIENTTNRAGTLSRLDVRAKRSGCPSKNSGRVLWRLRSLRLKAGGSRRLSDTIETDSPLEDGEWCVKIELEYSSGEVRQFGRTSYFRVSDPSGAEAVDAGADVKELGGPVYADTGSWPNGGSRPESGCGCGTSGADESPQMLIWMLVLVFLFRGHRLFPALKSGFDCSRDR